MNAALVEEFSRESLTQWLVEKVAHYLEKNPSEIDPHQHLADYGLDSVYAIRLCGDIEELIKMPVEPTLVWDYPSIDEMVQFLEQELGTPIT
ncbi:MAG: acyl carrier protein [Microcystis wesenbergii Mw_QC_B_20070930_S4]|jgi:acyl carrier protein|nr:MAG: acyl carrier protein [Microcystis wesenbergii Mw_QC_B_20070930_S4D]TRV15803.1 MAG: acyl carrier protein [Microcystis wesenbergii Mw_QC_B_20070930_S4]